jgi:hypothetical protein
MTIRMYACKGWPLTSVSVDVTHNEVHGRDAVRNQIKDRQLRSNNTCKATLTANALLDRRPLPSANHWNVSTTLKQNYALRSAIFFRLPLSQKYPQVGI